MLILEDYITTFGFSQTEAKTKTILDRSRSDSSTASGYTNIKNSDADLSIAPPSAADYALVFDDLDLDTASNWICDSQTRRNLRSVHTPELIHTSSGPEFFKDEAYVTPNISPAYPTFTDFATSLTTTPSSDSHDSGSKFDPAPLFLSLFNAYIEAHEAVAEISSGFQDVSMEDLKDGSRFMNTLRIIGEVGNTIANSPDLAMPSLQGLIDQGCLLFAFTTLLKACDLVEHVLKRILPGNSATNNGSLASRSTSTGFHAATYAKRPHLMGTYPTDIYLPEINQHSNHLAEHITTLVRLDLQLSHLNQFVSRFTDLARGQGISAHVPISQCQMRLLNFHGRISTVIESMTPSWNCGIL